MTDGWIEGRYFEANSSRFGTASMRHFDGIFTIAVDDDTRHITWGRPATDISDPVAGVPRRFGFPDGSVFEIDPGPDADTFVESLGLESGVRWSFKRHPKLMLGVLVATVLMPFALWFTFPVVTDAVALALPEVVPKTIGRNAFSAYDGTLFQASGLSEAEKAAVHGLFSEVVEASGASSEDFQLFLRQSSLIGANAIAFPDGSIVVTDDLVRISEHDDELVAVLAHELVHVSERHGIRSLVRSIGLAFLVQFVLGDTVSLLEEAATVGAGLVGLAYNRDFELEADSKSADIMRKLNRDPARLVSLLRRITERCGDACEETSLLSTHPGFQERLEAVGE